MLRKESLFSHHLIPNPLLFSRHLIPNPLCPICEREVETVTHILWNCPSWKDCWMECSRKFQKLTCADENLLVLIKCLMSNLDEEDIILVASVCRGIWFRKNEFIFEGVFTHHAQVVSKAKQVLEEFNHASLASSLERKDSTSSNLCNSIMR